MVWTPSAYHVVMVMFWSGFFRSTLGDTPSTALSLDAFIPLAAGAEHTLCGCSVPRTPREGGWGKVRGFLTHHEAKDHGGEEAADEALPGLLRGELQEGGHTQRRPFNITPSPAVNM